MTVVFAIAHEGLVHMTADSLSGRADDGGIMETSAMPKIVRILGPVGRGWCPSLLFGFTTSWRFGQVAEQALAEAGWKAARFEEGPVEPTAPRRDVRLDPGPPAPDRGMPWPRDRRQLLAPLHDRDDEDADYIRRWAVGWLVPTLRVALKAAGFSEVKDNREKGGYGLAAIRGRVFQIQDDFSVMENAEGYAAVGAGEEVALGALAATDDLPLTMERRIEIVARAVERHMVWVRGPWKTEIA